jgi:hypothetical protein
MESYKPQEEQETERQFSPEQEKALAELLGIVKPLFDSFTSSNDAYETATGINQLYDDLKKEYKDPKNFYLWSLLVPYENAEASPNFDTPKGEIEEFIRSLKVEKGESLVEDEEQLAA